MIGARDLKTLLTWIDAAYAVHPDMRGQTGGTMSLGTGVVHGRSSKQKLNAKSSTEAEIIGVSEYLPFHIWAVNFLNEQGYNIDRKLLYQDNQSAIRLEKNGRNSCTGNSRHIDIRYFFVKDRVDSGNMEIQYCPTEEMLADFFSKPLQGKLFRKFRDLIMGYVNIPETFFDITQIKEHVEKPRNYEIKNNRTYIEAKNGERQKKFEISKRNENSKKELSNDENRRELEMISDNIKNSKYTYVQRNSKVGQEKSGIKETDKKAITNKQIKEGSENKAYGQSYVDTKNSVNDKSRLKRRGVDFKYEMKELGKKGADVKSRKSESGIEILENMKSNGLKTIMDDREEKIDVSENRTREDTVTNEHVVKCGKDNNVRKTCNKKVTWADVVKQNKEDKGNEVVKLINLK